MKTLIPTEAAVLLLLARFAFPPKWKMMMMAVCLFVAWAVRPLFAYKKSELHRSASGPQVLKWPLPPQTQQGRI